MENQQKYVVVWDQTGVLFKNGREYVTRSFKKVFEELGINYTDEYFSEKYKGTSLKEQFRMWKDDFGFSCPISLEEFSKKSGPIQLEELRKNKEEEKDTNLYRLLKELNEKEITQVVASSSSSNRAESILEILDQKKYIKNVYTVYDVKNHEPETDLLEYISKDLNVPLQNMIVIEDGVSGIEAAKKAGCKTIGYAAHGKAQEEAIRNSKPNLVISSFGELSVGKLEELVNV